MTNDIMLGSLYLLMAMMLVLGALINRREPFAKMVTMFLAWIAIFGAGFVIFTFRDDLRYVAARLTTEATGQALVVAGGKEVRVPMAIDGHFWVEGDVNGLPVKFLVDSGATMTTISRADAAQARLTIDDSRGQVVRTGNGLVRVSTARTPTLRVASIERENVGVHVADDDLSVLGMNFLSSLDSWSVKGRWLIMRP